MKKYLFLLFALILSFNINAQESVKIINDTMYVSFKFNETVLNPENENLMDSIFSTVNSIVVVIANPVANERHSKKLSEDRLEYIELFLYSNDLLNIDVSKRNKQKFNNRYRKFHIRWRMPYPIKYFVND